MSLTVVTSAVAIYPEAAFLSDSARLTLRIRELDPEQTDELLAHPERLRIFRADSQASGDAALDIALEDLELVELPENEGGGYGVRFPINRLGRYLVAVEVVRPRDQGGVPALIADRQKRGS